MKRKPLSFWIVALTLATVILTTGCDRNPKQASDSNIITLSPPSNVNIDVSGRIMTVTWDEVDGAQGYMIVLTSADCSSGNRTIDTKAGTAVITSSGNSAANVEITGKTSLKITLMAARNDPNIAMANAVTAKVMSLGGAISKSIYVDSDYSEVVSKPIDK